MSVAAPLGAPAPRALPADGPRRLLAGPPTGAGPEPFAAHAARVGLRPAGGTWLIEELEASGLQGRGGAWFPTGRRWRALAGRSRGDAVVIANLSEGEPLSAKDRTLAEARPHLILDGAELAAESVGAAEIVLYVARPWRRELRALRRALAERRAGPAAPRVRVVRAAHRYVAGESSSVVNRAGGGPALPTFGPPHPSERGVGGRPTLVQNAETLAHAALIARRGAAWFREAGTPGSPGTALMTLCGGVANPGVYEVDLDGTLAEVVAAAGGDAARSGGALLGGYFGAWLAPAALATLPLDVGALRQAGAALGCGVLGVLPAGACGIAEAARIAAYMAAESAGQCGPCALGLPAMAGVMTALARCQAVPTEVARLRRWADQVRGRGACHHPDGAVDNMVSALDVFAGHLEVAHLRDRRCPAALRPTLPAPPRPGWRRR